MFVVTAQLIEEIRHIVRVEVDSLVRQKADDGEELTVAQAARALCVTSAAVYKAVARGRIPRRTVGNSRRLRIRRADLAVLR